MHKTRTAALNLIGWWRSIKGLYILLDDSQSEHSESVEREHLFSGGFCANDIKPNEKNATLIKCVKNVPPFQLSHFYIVCICVSLSPRHGILFSTA